MPFNGKATYDNFPQIGQDISSILLLMNPTEIPILSRLSTPQKPATSTVHEWSEQELVPDRVINSGAINSVAVGDTYLFQINGYGGQLQVGMLAEVEVATGIHEVTQINTIVGVNTIGMKRGINNVINSLAPGGKVFIISTAEQEGSETSGDVTNPRTRRNNSTMIFKKPVTISGSDQSVITMPDVGSEFDHQTTLRTMELVRDLEKAVIRSVRISSAGADDVYRTMNGLRAQLTNINSAVVVASFAANPIKYINNMLQETWNAGARDLNVLAVGATWKRDISNTNESFNQTTQDERGIERLVQYVVTDFGQLEVVLSPWMPDSSMMGLATGRVFPMPLRGRSFQREILAKTGDSFKGHVIGEYTLETHHPDKMFQAYGS